MRQFQILTTLTKSTSFEVFTPRFTTKIKNKVQLILFKAAPHQKNNFCNSVLQTFT